MNLQKKIDNNIWETLDDFSKIMLIIEDMKNEKWFWFKNMQCKYINIRMDMRDGHFMLFDRDDNRIEIKDLERQQPFDT